MISKSPYRKYAFDVLVRGAEWSAQVEKALRQVPRPARRQVTLLSEWKTVNRFSSVFLIIVSDLKTLIQEAELERVRQIPSAKKKIILFAGDIPLESIPEYFVNFNVRGTVHIHLTRAQGAAATALLQRFVNGLCSRHPQTSILDAWREGDVFKIKSPTMDMLNIPIKSMPKLAGISMAEFDRFEIDPAGEAISWPRRDVRMDWTEFVQIVSPEFNLRDLQKSKEFNERYGSAIRTLREATGLTHSDVKGLVSRSVYRIERGDTRATAKALRKLAAAHGMTIEKYLERVDEILKSQAGEEE